LSHYNQLQGPIEGVSEVAAHTARWDIARLIAAFGGARPCMAAHRSLGYRALTLQQIRNWQNRGTLPSTRLAELLATLIKTRRKDVRINDFLIL
jgi:hypothetical protein